MFQTNKQILKLEGFAGDHLAFQRWRLTLRTPREGFPGDQLAFPRWRLTLRTGNWRSYAYY